MRCPACYGPTTNTGFIGDRPASGLCDACEAEIRRQDEEYGQYLANASLLQKLVWKVEGVFNRVRNSIYRMNVCQKRGTV